jgi:hypothetical protein
MKEYIQRKYYLVKKAIISMARNIVEGVKFTCTMKMHFAHAAECS